MNISATVYGAPCSSQSAYTAYRFLRTALEQGHRVERVFFYHEGVYNATDLAAPPRDEFDLIRAWRKLKSDYNVDLVVCIAAALRRGVLNESEAQRHDKTAHNLPDEFEISGLGQLVEAAATSDRFITFGG